LLLTGTLPTGYAIGFITPDSERTFATYLGAATEISPEKLSEEMFAGHKIFHIEGYLIIDHPLILNALKLAKEAGVEVSYDMASYNVVEDNREFIRKILTEYVDIVFANEEEARAFSGKDPEQAVEDLGQYCKIAVVKTGASGSLIRMEKENYMVKAIKAKRIDTTGAGDLYAAGFLHGYLRGMLPEQCGRIGSLMGGKVIETIGTKMSKSTWDEIFRQVRQISED
jgi:sugar/nucleoside kinase (ribokinase family)